PSQRAPGCAPGRDQAEMISIRKERPLDVAAREALLDEAFGKRRWLKSSQRLRDGRRPADDLAFVATDRKRVVGTARCWDIVCGTGQTALLLGPVAMQAIAATAVSGPPSCVMRLPRRAAMGIGR